MIIKKTAISLRHILFLIKLFYYTDFLNLKILAYDTSSNRKIYIEKLYAPEGTNINSLIYILSCLS